MRSTLVSGRDRLALEYRGKAATLLERAHVLVSRHGVTSCRGPALSGD